MALSLQQQAKRRAERNRRRLKAVANGRLRLSVHRSDKNISAQVIDDAQGVTVAAASSLEGGKGSRGSDVAAAAKIDAAASQSEALSFLDRAERAALLSDPALLERWAALPR